MIPGGELPTKKDGKKNDDFYNGPVFWIFVGYTIYPSVHCSKNQGIAPVRNRTILEDEACFGRIKKCVHNLL
jgi:hypothetical protein